MNHDFRLRISRPAQELEARCASRSNEGFDCDFLVVGSGYGGAVAAARLAGRAVKGRAAPATVWVLERGMEYLPGDFPSRFAELAGHVRFSYDGAPTRGRHEGLFDVRLGGGVTALVASGVGGGSLINAGVMLAPDPAVWSDPRWPEAIRAEAAQLTAAQAAHGMAGASSCKTSASLDASPLCQGLARARQALCGAVPTAASQDPVPAKYQVLQALAAEDLEAMPCDLSIHRGDPAIGASGVALRTCTGCGDCVTGCNQGAKVSLDTAYLAQAHAAGATIFSGATVLRLQRPAPGGGEAAPDGSAAAAGWSVHWCHTNPQLRGAGADVLEIRARRVILAAGALGSTEILLRSKGEDLQLSELIGQRFSGNGDQIALGLGHWSSVRSCADPDDDPFVAGPAGRDVGSTITGMIRVPAGAPHGQQHPGPARAFVLQELAIPAALKNVYAEVAATAGVLKGFPQAGAGTILAQDPFVARRSTDHLSAYVMMGDDEAPGTLTPAWAEGEAAGRQGESPQGDGRIRLNWPGPVDGSPDEIRRNAQRTWLHQRLSSAIAHERARQTAEDPSLIADPGVEEGPVAMLDNVGVNAPVTVHPLGGCPMAADPTSGVVDADGKVFHAGRALDDLVVLDGAIVPMPLGVNPALTIAALAERAMVALCDAWTDASPGASVDAGARTCESPDCGDGEPAARAGGEPPRPSLYAPGGVPEPHASAFRRELPVARSVWRLRERMHGAADFPGRPLWGMLDMEFEAIPGWRRMLDSTLREVMVPRASLRLWALQDSGDGHPLRWTDDTPLCTATLAGTVALFQPVGPRPASGPRATGLRYRFTVQAVTWREGEPADPGLVGLESRLEATKTVDAGAPGTTSTAGLLRRLSEAEVWIGGRALGRWSLDLNELADQEEALVQLLESSSMPDALDDLASLGLYLARRSYMELLAGMGARARKAQATCAAGNDSPPAGHGPAAAGTRGMVAKEPPPRPVDGAVGKRFEVGTHGAFLTRYCKQGQGGGRDIRPVLLIHGLGMSGSTFTTSVGAQGSIVARLLAAGFNPWVLDVRSSTDNLGHRHDPQAAQWTVDTIATEDVAQALRQVYEVVEQRPIDVLAHCMGAVMFCMCILADPKPGFQVGAAVLSQVGPLARLTPLNRLRGFLAAYAQRYLHVEEFDPHTSASDAKTMLADLIAYSFPYDDAELKDEAAAARALNPTDWEALEVIRRRADAMFGQLFQIGKLHPAALAALGSMLGWVKVPMLAQALHFARQNMLTDSEGQNSFLTADALAERFGFPVLMVHGMRSGVFDWRGSAQSLMMLDRARGLEKHSEDQFRKAGGQLFKGLATRRRFGSAARRSGDAQVAQLLLLRHHGHLDSLIGEQSLVPDAIRFFQRARSSARASSAEGASARSPDRAVTGAETCDLEEPWIGPMLGWSAMQGEHLVLRVLLGASPRRADPPDVALVPIVWKSGGAAIHCDKARLVPSDPTLPRRGPRVLEVRLLVRESSRWSAVAVVLVHQSAGMGVDPAQARRARVDLVPRGRGPSTLLTGSLSATLVSGRVDNLIPSVLEEENWLVDGQVPVASLRNDLKAFLESGEAGRLDRCALHLGESMLRLASSATGLGINADASLTNPAEAAPLQFIATSCQYPAGLLDHVVANQAYEAMADLAASTDGPQAAFLLGDQVYLDETAGLFEPTAMVSPVSFLAGARTVYERAWRMPGLRRLARQIPVLPLMDDHEVVDNWQPGAAGAATPRERSALELHAQFQRALIQASCSPIHGEGYWITLAGARVFALDTRSRRDARGLSGAKGRKLIDAAHIIPKTEIDQLIERMKAAPDSVAKIVLSPSPLLPPEREMQRSMPGRLRSDAWSGYPASLVQLLEGIRGERILRVVLVSGDAHLSSVTEFVFEDDADTNANPPLKVISVVASGSYTPWPFANQSPLDLVRSGKVSIGAQDAEAAAAYPGGAAAFAAVRGQVQVRAMTTASGFAVLDLEVSPEAPRCHSALNVAFVSPQTEPVRCRCTW